MVGEQMKDVCLKTIVKHDRCSIMVWRCLTENGVSDLFRNYQIMNAENNKKILIHHAIPSGNCFVGNCFIFQQDNNSQRTTLRVKVI